MGIKSTDMITGGFPCQDVSNIGQHKGLQSMRSGLCYQLFRLTDELQPTFLFLENVPALIKHLQKILDELHRRGFDARWTTLEAGNLGAPHKRQRIFILACRSSRASASSSSTGSADPPDITLEKSPSLMIIFSCPRCFCHIWPPIRARMGPCGPECHFIWFYVIYMWFKLYLII